MRVRYFVPGSRSRAHRSSLKNAVPISARVPKRASRLSSKPLPLPPGTGPAVEQLTPIQPLEREPVPGQNHPIHYQALRPELSLNKLATGLIPVKFENKTALQAVLKLYSHGTIDETTFTSVGHQKLQMLFQANKTLLSGTAWSVFYYLYLVALGGLRLHEHSRNAMSQIFSNEVQGRRLSPGKLLSGSARRWNLFCCLARSGGVSETLSRPYISLQNTTTNIEKWCRLDTRRAKPSMLALNLTVAGSLKAISSHVPATGHPHDFANGGALQSIVDDLAIQSMDAVIGKAFSSPGAILAAVTQRLLIHLPSSPLAAALDLEHLGVLLKTDTVTRRIEQNILLNPDGTVKTTAGMPLSLPIRESTSGVDFPTGNVTSQPDIEPPVACDAERTDTARSEQGSITSEKPKGSGEPEGSEKPKGSDKPIGALWNFSESTQRKLGAELTWQISPELMYGPVDDQRLVLQEMDRIAQGSDSRGITLLAKAASTVFQAWSAKAKFRIAGLIHVFPSSASSDMSSSEVARVRGCQKVQVWEAEPGTIGLRTTAKGPNLLLRLPGILGVKGSLSGDTCSLHFLVSLNAPIMDNIGRSSTRGSSFALSDDISILAKSTRRITEVVCQATTFGSLESCAHTVAEALLRFLKLRCSDMPISKIRVRALLETEPSKFSDVRVTATWDTESQSSGAGESTDRQVRVATVGKPSPPTATDNATKPGETGHIEEDNTDQENENGCETDQAELNEVSVAGSDTATVKATAAANEAIDLADETFDERPGADESHGNQVASSDRLIPAHSGDASTQAKSDDVQTAVEAKNSWTIKWRPTGYGVPNPYLYTGFIRSGPVAQQFGFEGFCLRAVWSPRHASDLSQGSTTITSEAVERAILQSGVTSLRALESAATTIAAAMPFNPFILELHLDTHSDTGLLRDSHAESLARHVRATRRILRLSARVHRPDGFPMPFTTPGISVEFPTLNFINTSVALPVSRLALAQSILGVNVTLRGTDPCAIGSTNGTSLARMEALCEHVRTLVASTLTSQTWDSGQEFAEKCSEAVLHTQQPLDGALSVCEVDVQLQFVNRPMPRAAALAIQSDHSSVSRAWVRKYIAFGSNLGDRIGAIEQACRNLDSASDIRILETSPLYETDPMYVTDQDRFLNGVCEIETKLEPVELLDRLQTIENDLGRHKTIDKGPRNIDLDILTYGQRTVKTDRLTIPHALMLEREFVLRPLCDTFGRHWSHPWRRLTAKTILHDLPTSSTPMFPLTALGAGLEPLRSLDPRRKTQVMSILNVTPDSFSDGGVNLTTDVDTLRNTILANIAAGATIIDIGGQSSRPNAEDVSAEEEINRLLPAIELIKSLPEAKGIAISVDTYRAAVAEAAINAGAHIVNDISAGLLDAEMLPTVARLGCTYIMMHMRGTPATMQSEENTSYPDGLIPTVAYELRERLNAAQQAGIRRWRIILDPGIGFAKTMEQNLELLQRLGELRNLEPLRTYPWLVGSSRKGFIGKITGVTDAKARVSGTAATVTAAVQGGAEIVRVHDVKEMVEVVKMADAMYRS